MRFLLTVWLILMLSSGAAVAQAVPGEGPNIVKGGINDPSSPNYIPMAERADAVACAEILNQGAKVAGLSSAQKRAILHQGATINGIDAAELHRANSGAVGKVASVTNPQVTTSTARLAVCPCAPGLLFERIVFCFASVPDGSLFKAVSRIIGQAEPYFRVILGSVIFLSVLIFGYKLVAGAVFDMKKETVVLMFKIGAAMLFLINFQLFYAFVVNITWGLGNIAGSLTQGFGDICQHPAKANGQLPSMWAQVDCMLDKLTGIRSNAMVVGIIPFAVLMIFTSSIGSGIFFGIAALLMTLFLALMRLLHVYFSAMITIALLLLLAPLFVPMIFFANTLPRFSKWSQMLLGNMLVPMLLYIFLALSLVMFEYSLFVGPTSLLGSFSANSSPTTASHVATSMQDMNGKGFFHRIVNKQTTVANANVNPGQITSVPGQTGSVNNGGNTTAVPSGPSPPAGATVNPNVVEVGFIAPSLDDEQLSQDMGFADKFAMYGKIVINLLSSIIMAFIAYQIFGAAPRVSGQLVEHVFQNGTTQSQLLGQASLQKGLAVAKETGRRNRNERRDRNKFGDTSKNTNKSGRSALRQAVFHMGGKNLTDAQKDRMRQKQERATIQKSRKKHEI